MTKSTKTRVGLLSATMISGALFAMPAMAQEAETMVTTESTDDAIIVTATRRSTTIMDTPINISVLGSQEIERQRLGDIRDIADFTPGVTISDTGARSTGTIVLRGLRASDTNGGGSNSDNSLGIYMGEVPLFYDFKILDIDRVETLLGPQGTLYGLGTLAGAIRYLPNRPDTSGFEGEVHSRVMARKHSDSFGYQVDGVINIPIVRDHIAFRSATGYYFDPGFIDYPLLVQEPGVSLPQPDGPVSISDAGYAANLYELEDLNFERTLTTRNQLLLQTSEDLKFFLTYAYQKTKTQGAQTNSDGVLGTGRYENASRFSEPAQRRAHLFSAEVNANVADIFDVVATGAYTQVDTHSEGDVTDLLLDLDYDYELFPAFAGFNDSTQTRKQKNAEIRFVSRHGGPLSWVVGGFYNEQKFQSDYFESLPNHPWADPDTNPDFLEYVSYVTSEVEEKAIFGEGTFEITPEWQVTAGARYFDYTSSIVGAATLPFFQQLSPYDRNPSGGNAGDDGVVWKFNTSYEITPDIMLYSTYSKGYRIGGPNRVAPCDPSIPTDPTQYTGPQVICALPNEIQYGPDTTKNIEVGLRTQLFDDMLSFNFNVYHIDWSGIQVASATTYGVTGITVNGGSAKSKGFEMSFSARPTPELTFQGTYSYTDAFLTEDVPGLISVNSPAGTYPSSPISLAGLAGDRLPGSTKNSGSLGATYVTPMGDADIIANWTMTYRGNVVSRLGWERTFGDRIPSYILNRASVTYEADTFSLSLFADNIFNEYAVASVAEDRSRVGVNDGVVLRYLEQVVITPRTVGIEGRISF